MQPMYRRVHSLIHAVGILLVPPSTLAAIIGTSYVQYKPNLLLVGEGTAF
jgi:hypothetical protein